MILFIFLATDTLKSKGYGLSVIRHCNAILLNEIVSSTQKSEEEFDAFYAHLKNRIREYGVAFEKLEVKEQDGFTFASLIVENIFAKKNVFALGIALVVVSRIMSDFGVYISKYKLSAE